jgi:hypothetical protein
LPAFGRLSVLLTEPPLWFWEIDGSKIELNTRELQDPVAFQSKCMEKLRKMPPIVKRDVWQALVDEKMRDMDLIPAPAEASPKGQFWEMLESFCTGRAQAMSRDELLLGKPWTNDGRTYFRQKDMRAYLRRQSFKGLDDNQIMKAVKDGGGTFGKWNVKGTTCHWWSVPAFVPQSEPHDIPKAVSEEKQF